MKQTSIFIACLIGAMHSQSSARAQVLIERAGGSHLNAYAATANFDQDIVELTAVSGSRSASAYSEYTDTDADLLDYSGAANSLVVITNAVSSDGIIEDVVVSGGVSGVGYFQSIASSGWYFTVYESTHFSLEAEVISGDEQGGVAQFQFIGSSTLFFWEFQFGTSAPTRYEFDAILEPNTYGLSAFVGISSNNSTGSPRGYSFEVAFASVPEPSVYALIAVALGALLLCRRGTSDSA